MATLPLDLGLNYQQAVIMLRIYFTMLDPRVVPKLGRWTKVSNPVMADLGLPWIFSFTKRLPSAFLPTAVVFI